MCLSFQLTTTEYVITHDSIRSYILLLLGTRVLTLLVGYMCTQSKQRKKGKYVSAEICSLPLSLSLFLCVKIKAFECMRTHNN